MKHIKKYKTLLVLALAMVAFSGCEKGDGDSDYGFAYIYMPQATVTDGLSNNYAVPSGGGAMTYNFKINADGNLDVTLGVLKGGKFDQNEAFSVNVAANEALTTAALASVANSVAMPASMYLLPSKVDVAAGEVRANFYLTVDADALDLAAYTGKKLILSVGLNSPTKYELAPNNTNTLVVIDVNAIRAFL